MLPTRPTPYALLSVSKPVTCSNEQKTTEPILPVDSMYHVCTPKGRKYTAATEPGWEV